jgi:hypothetical protein
VFTVVEILLIFVAPGMAAALAIGSGMRKLLWYAGTAVLVFGAAILISFVGGFLQVVNASNAPLIGTYTMLIVDIFMIAAATSTGKECPACHSRIDPKTTRCAKCQKDLTTS